MFGQSHPSLPSSSVSPLPGLPFALSGFGLAGHKAGNQDAPGADFKAQSCGIFGWRLVAETNAGSAVLLFGLTLLVFFVLLFLLFTFRWFPQDSTLQHCPR